MPNGLYVLMVEDNVTPTEKPTDGTQEEPVASG